MKKNNKRIVNYDGIEDFSRKGLKAISRCESMDIEWYGNITREECYDKATKGDDRLVAESEKYIEGLNLSIPDTKGVEYIPSMYGSRFKLGEYMSGSPSFMRRRVKRDNDISPVKIVVDMMVSCGISADTMHKRGNVILALLMKVQEVRPVELILVCGGGLGGYASRPSGYVYQVIPIESKPLNISQAAFVLTSVGFVRHFAFSLYLDMKEESDTHDCIPWPEGKDSKGYEGKVKDRLGLGEKDIYIKGAHLYDDMLDEPVRWLQDQLDRLNKVEGEEV